jgi:IS30 family transposase
MAAIRAIPAFFRMNSLALKIQEAEGWINNYPRKILDFETAEKRFIRELAA